ncbi:McrC family protein [Streptomyces sp. UC4497]
MTTGPGRRVIVLSEYESRVVEGAQLTARDRDLTESPALNRLITLRSLDRDRLEIRADCHVGVVELDAMEIRVVPKLVGGNLNVLRMMEYTSATTAAHQLDIPRTLETGDPHLRDLICHLLNRTTAALLRHGPRRDYLTRTDALPVLRGRLLPTRQLLRRHGRLDRLECRYDERSTDIPDNQLCAEALSLAARTASDVSIRSQSRRLAADFAALCDPARYPHGHDHDYGRHNEHYRPAHRWARLLLAGAGIHVLFATGAADSRVFLLDMNTLFEDFVTRLVSRALAPHHVTVHAQSRHQGILVHEDTGATHTELRPDLLLTQGHGPTARRHPIDIKYKLYAQRKLSAADLYQSFAYAHTLAGTHTDASATATCTLLYPSAGPAAPRSVAVRPVTGSRSARITAYPLDVATILDALTAGDAPSAYNGLAPALLQPLDGTTG